MFCFRKTRIPLKIPLKTSHKFLLAFAGALLIPLFFRLYPLLVYPWVAADNKAHFLLYANIQKANDKYIESKYAAQPKEKRDQIKSDTLRKLM